MLCARIVFQTFPKLQEDGLRELTLCIYQIKLTKSYTKEHLKDGGEYEVLVNKPNENSGKIQCRHVSNKVCKLWIKYNEVLVKGWYYQYRVGTRVVGASAHVTSVLWYLGCTSYQGIVRLTGVFI